jgi:hypothetical protein
MVWIGRGQAKAANDRGAGNVAPLVIRYFFCDMTTGGGVRIGALILGC